MTYKSCIAWGSNNPRRLIYSHKGNDEMTAVIMNNAVRML
jgi:hypothetical protein